MRRCQFPIYHEDEDIYISVFGLEKDGEDAFWGPGRRSQCIIHYVISGEGYFNGQPVHEDQGFYIESSQLVEYYPNPENPWNYFWIDCSKEFANRYLRNTLPLDDHGIFNYDFKSKLLRIIDRVMNCDHRMEIVEAMGYAFSILMLHSAQSEATAKPLHYVQQAKNYIESGLNRKLTVKDVAEAVSINDRYMYLLFMKHEGISPKDYILKRKTETAADLLETTDLSIMEIAAAVGFHDIYSFSKAFKLRYNIPPTKYRQMIK